MSIKTLVEKLQNFYSAKEAFDLMYLFISELARNEVYYRPGKIILDLDTKLSDDHLQIFEARFDFLV